MQTDHTARSTDLIAKHMPATSDQQASGGLATPGLAGGDRPVQVSRPPIYG
jgi:hypothetical protein